jgi:hypothetical protein
MQHGIHQALLAARPVASAAATTAMRDIEVIAA